MHGAGLDGPLYGLTVCSQSSPWNQFPFVSIVFSKLFKTFYQRMIEKQHFAAFKKTNKTRKQKRRLQNWVVKKVHFKALPSTVTGEEK